MEFAKLVSAGAITAFFQVVLIDLALAGDNAVAVGMAAAGLPAPQRRRAIVLGLTAAVAMLIGFALITTQLLKIVGLLVVGGILLLWVCWKMFRDLRAPQRKVALRDEDARQAISIALVGLDEEAASETKTLSQAMVQILVADLAVSLDNVLAVAGAARRHPWVLVGGLLLSITLTGFAASFIARLLNRLRWIGYVGLSIVIYVALHMVWEGARTVVIDTGQVGAFNATMPQVFAIQPDEIARRRNP